MVRRAVRRACRPLQPVTQSLSSAAPTRRLRESDINRESLRSWAPIKQKQKQKPMGTCMRRLGQFVGQVIAFAVWRASPDWTRTESYALAEGAHSRCQWPHPCHAAAAAAAAADVHTCFMVMGCNECAKCTPMSTYLIRLIMKHRLRFRLAA